ncbi:MAG: hypothetical protein ACRED5_04170 [Propylenella sp.]
MTLKTALPAAIFVLALSTLPASAHDFWINHGSYKSPKGEHCCGDNDCFLVPASDMQSTAAGWLIKSLGETIPYGEAQSSEDGEFWRCKRYDGSRRCFFAPQPSS